MHLIYSTCLEWEIEICILEREREMIMIKSKERKHSYPENEERASLNCPSISPLSFTVFKLYNNLNSVHDIKKEDVWRRDDIWWIHTKENDIISYFVLFSVSFCFCRPLRIVHKLTKRKLRRQFSAKILDKCSGSSKGAKGYLSRGIIHIYLKSAPPSNTPQNFLASSAAQVPPRANNILGDVHTTSVEP